MRRIGLRESGGQEGACLSPAERQSPGRAGEWVHPEGLRCRGPGYKDMTPGVAGGHWSLKPPEIGSVSLHTQKQVQPSARVLGRDLHVHMCSHPARVRPG